MDYQSLLERKLIPQDRSGREYIYACPECEDPNRGHHLYVNYDKNVFRCVKCNFSGRSLSKLARRLGIDVSYDYESLYSESAKELDSIISQSKSAPKSSKVDYSTDLDTLTQYYEYHTKMLSLWAYSYLLGRGVSPETIITYGLREGINRYGDSLIINGKEYKGRDYSGRILVPSLRKDGGISYFVARDYIGDKKTKYLNPPKEIAVSSEDVFNLEILESDITIICEGVFTSLAVNQALGERASCATYGKSIASKSSDISAFVTSQGEKILSKKSREYVMFYDKDAIKEAYQNAKYLHDRGARVRVVKIPDDMYGEKADAADMTPDEIKLLISTAEPFDNLAQL